MTKLLLLTITLISLSCFSQTNNDTSLHISIWTPRGWFTGNKKILKENLTNYKISKDDLNKLGNTIDTSRILGIYYKYDPKTHYGLVPTIKFYIRQNDTNSFDKFLVSIKDKIEKIEPYVLNFKYIDTPQTITVGQRKAFYASATYNLKVQTGETAIIRTKFLCIPMSRHYLDATLIDNNEEDCSNIYKEVINKIKVQ
ncbi:hypothetical protein [Niabella hirudinis]|uniref:hypothetical protein n=1 Tax=Niabella hirudinis TaxID=1285929 RepID=UPI003EC10F7B